MTFPLRWRLSIMMFLQYFIWGSWYVTMGPYLGGTLGFTAEQVGYAYNSTALAAMISPFLVGMVADRFFATERVLAVLHLLGGICLFGLTLARDFAVFYPVLIAHTLCYMPTLALTNSLSFHQLKDPDREFPGIRVLGTISWIAAGLTVNSLGERATSTSQPFLLAAAVSVMQGFYCLSLPHTPPPGRGRNQRWQEVAGFSVLRMVRDRSFAVFLASAFLVCIPLTFYFSFTPSFLEAVGVENVPAKMTLGQASEILFMVLLPWFLVRLGVKWMMVVGMLAWAVRYGLFALGSGGGPESLLLAGVLLHGICYDFFFVTAYLYGERRAPAELRGQMQGLIAFVTLGLGMFVGANVSGWVVTFFSQPDPLWSRIWMTPAVAAIGVMILFLALFREGDRSNGRGRETPPPA